jgi:tRNA pseudouridine55 synthase
LLVDKPAGPTSHDVVARARRAFGIRAVGHAGTLDPFATGLLVLVLGSATRLARFVEAEPKTYLATALLGVRTATDDATGEVVARREPDAWPPRNAVEQALGRLVGTQLQRPPVYSAKLVGGQRSYRLARKGAEVALEPVEITVHGIGLTDYQPPLVSFRATVSSGTYVRALGRDLGEALGLGAHLTSLRREAIGPFHVARAVTLDRLDGGAPIIPPETLVAGLPRVELGEDEVAAVTHGRMVHREGTTDGEAALLADGQLLAVARAVPGGWHPSVVIRAVAP